MTCSRCGSAIVTPEQFERGLCAMCWTGASLQPMAPEHLVCPCNTVWASTAPRPVCPHHGRQIESVEIEVSSVGTGTCIGGFMAPIYFGHPRTDSEWKREQFPTPEVM